VDISTSSGLVDEFIIYDTAQFTKNDWRNRNRIKTVDGLRWLTVPVMTAGRFGQTIQETQVVDSRWAAKHWRSLSQSYEHAPYWRKYRDRFAEVYRTCSGLRLLTEINQAFIGTIVSELNIPTRISRASDYEFNGDQTGRLVALCRLFGATSYISGPRGRSYLNLSLFAEAGIDVEFMNYSAYSPYPQLHGAFEPAVTILDLLFNVGPEAIEYMICGHSRELRFSSHNEQGSTSRP
jgi:hypothetical protein